MIPAPVPRNVGDLRTRIIIDVDPMKGTSVLKTEGMLTVHGVMSVLLAQLSTLFNNQLMQSMGIVDTSGKVVQRLQTSEPPPAADGKAEGVPE